MVRDSVMWLFLLTAYMCDAAPQVPGGFSSEAITTDIRDVVNEAVSLFSSEARITGSDCSNLECNHAELLEILEVRSQLVAGDNYQLKLKLETRDGPGCGNRVEQICENIVVHQPLSHMCFVGKCLQLIRQEEIVCNALTPPPICDGPPISGGFSSVAITPAIRDVVKGALGLFASEDKITGSDCANLECPVAELLEIKEVKRQVVAGDNYKLQLKLETRDGPQCGNRVEQICENIVVYQPLPHECFGGNCLQLIRQQEIVCDALTPPPICGDLPPIVGGFSTLKNIPQKVVILAQRATQELFHLENRISGACGQKPQLVEVLEAASQVVAGTNYKLKLSIVTKEGQGCFTEVEKICDNIVLNLPIPCFGGDCLGLIDQNEISCFNI